MYDMYEVTYIIITVVDYIPVYGGGTTTIYGGTMTIYGGTMPIYGNTMTIYGNTMPMVISCLSIV